jgi:hypothetical protein
MTNSRKRLFAPGAAGSLQEPSKAKATRACKCLLLSGVVQTASSSLKPLHASILINDLVAKVACVSGDV